MPGAGMGDSGPAQQLHVCSWLCSLSCKQAEVAVAAQQDKTLAPAPQHQLHSTGTEHRRWALPALQQGRGALSLPKDVCDSA